MKPDKKNSTQLLRITLFAGLILLIFTGIVLTVLFLMERDASETSRRHDAFYRILREYDTAKAEIFGTEREYDYLNSELDRLERRAIGVESWLSILKRRRALSLEHPPSLANYRKSINSALAVYPASEQIAAIAAAAIVKNSAITNEAEMQVRQLLSIIDNHSFNTIRLSFHVLLGDFKNPQSAAIIPADIDFVTSLEEPMAVNMAILKILRADYQGVTADIQTLLHSSPLPETLRFLAEYHYDFGNLLHSAGIFSLIDDDAANIRQADALYLAGYSENAKTIWNLLANSLNETSLYNLAVLAQEQEQYTEAAVFLEKLIAINLASSPVNQSAFTAGKFGLIRHSRMLDTARAVTVLQTNVNFPPANFPFIDLEICKRQTQNWVLGRQIAETWMLLDRHPGIFFSSAVLTKPLFFWIDYQCCNLIFHGSTFTGLCNLWLTVTLIRQKISCSQFLLTRLIGLFMPTLAVSMKNEDLLPALLHNTNRQL
jgi:tetratricopeptide (TPR) repeat protein